MKMLEDIMLLSALLIVDGWQICVLPVYHGRTL